MKIIDNSLCNIDFSSRATGKNVKDYIVALFECGATYIEIDSTALEYLSDVYTADRFIFRIEKPEDISVLGRKSFYSIVLSLNLLPIAQRLSRYNVILEIKSDNYTPQELLSLCGAINKADYISKIRIVRDFKDKSNELADFLYQYAIKDMTIPLDICPLNTELNGLDNAIYAYDTDIARTLTLAFGSSYLFTPFESFLLYLSQVKGINIKSMPTNVLIASLYVTATRFNWLTDDTNYALRNINDIVRDLKRNIPVTDLPSNMPKVPRRYAVKPKSNVPFPKVQQKYFNANDLEDDLCDELSKDIDDSEVNLYNRFYKKGLFEN